MTKCERAVVHAITAIVLACSVLACHGAPGPTVRIEVSPGNAAAGKVPKVFGYGGNIWWIPPAFGGGVAQRILGMERLGLTRISLGDQILSDAASMEDLRRRLENYPLNDFLREYTKAGGKVLFILDGVPRWVSSNKSTKTLPDPTQPVFRMSPPADFEEWSRVVETIVRHFNGKLALNAYYESWNEPSWYYLGTTEQYHKQYYHSVLGARRADPRALVGGPSTSEFLTFGTRGDPKGTDEEKLKFEKRFYEQQYAFTQFLQYAGRTPVPELGLKKLPVDFFSWHSFYIDPTKYYQLVVPAFRAALVAAGYPGNTPLINTEWNIAAVPPYPEGDVNATEVGASFVASTLIAMHGSSVDAQIFQMYVDPGVDGYLGGTFTQTGIPRANYNAFRLFSRLKGAELKTRTTDPWVSSVAFADDTNVYLMVTTFVPTRKMVTETVPIQAALQNEQFWKSIAAAQLVGKKELPEPFARQAREITNRHEKDVGEMTKKAAGWKGGLTLEIDLSGMPIAPGKATHYLIDSAHSNIYRDLPKAEKFLAVRLEQIQRDVRNNLVPRLQSAGVPRQTAERLGAASGNQGAVNDLMSTLPSDQRVAVTTTLGEISKEALSQYDGILGEIENWPSARLHEEAIAWPSSGILRIPSEPYAVHLFVLPK